MLNPTAATPTIDPLFWGPSPKRLPSRNLGGGYLIRLGVLLIRALKRLRQCHRRVGFRRKHLRSQQVICPPDGFRAAALNPAKSK